MLYRLVASTTQLQGNFSHLLIRRYAYLQEASTLLSALATALSNCRLSWPAFLPVHDPLRDAYWGVAVNPTATAYFDTDSIHVSKNPTQLQQV